MGSYFTLQRSPVWHITSRIISCHANTKLHATAPSTSKFISLVGVSNKQVSFLERKVIFFLHNLFTCWNPKKSPSKLFFFIWVLITLPAPPLCGKIPLQNAQHTMFNVKVFTTSSGKVNEQVLNFSLHVTMATVKPVKWDKVPCAKGLSCMSSKSVRGDILASPNWSSFLCGKVHKNRVIEWYHSADLLVILLRRLGYFLSSDTVRGLRWKPAHERFYEFVIKPLFLAVHEL